jgi:hypothetical protein
MTPRQVVIFVVLYGILVLGEWFTYLEGFDTSQWTLSNWLMLVFVLVAEAGAVAIITAAVDRALPASGNRPPTKVSTQKRRSSQRNTAR